MDPAARLLRLLSALQSRPSWTGAELASRLGVTTRTIRRDIVRLRNLGYPVETTPDGYELGVGGRLPPLLLDDDEAVAIAVGIRFSSTAAVSGVDAAAVAALAKLEQLMPGPLREQVRALHATTVEVRSPEVPTVAAETLITLATACRRQEGVRFSYRDHQGRQSHRTVEACETVHAAGRWYLVGRDRGPGEWRTFRIDRVFDASLTGHRYEWDDRPDAADLVARATRLVPFAVRARFLLEVDVDAARTLFPPTVGAIERGPAGRAILCVGASTLQGLVRFVAGLEVDAEVLDPPELRRAVHDLGRRLTARNPLLASASASAPSRERSEQSDRGGQDRSPRAPTVATTTYAGGHVLTDPRLFGVTILARDVEATAAFYREVLGLSLCEDRHGDGPLHYHAGWGFPESGLMFSLFPGAAPDPLHLSIITGEIDAAYQRALERGAAIEAPLGKNDAGSPPGWRDFVVRDPAGNLVTVCQAA